MVKILLYIKHRFNFIWQIIEGINGLLFGFQYKKRMVGKLDQLLSESRHAKYAYHKIEAQHLKKVSDFFDRQHPAHFRFFKPHTFDLKTLKRLHRNPAFLMMGVSDQDKIIGYFFLRCFINKKCFIGRMVDQDYHKQGIATGMNEIMYQTAWQNGFKCLTTISKQNKAIVHLHEKESSTVIIRELPNNYLLVEMKNPALTKV